MIPKVNAMILEEEEKINIVLPLRTEETCPYQDFFQLETDSEGVGTRLFFEQKEDLPKEGYEIRISKEGIRIRYAADAGMYYGLQTLTMMIRENGNRLQPCVICDSPAYDYRGFMLDVCRHFYTIDEVKKILDICSALKLNVFHWHLSDDQGFRIESRRFPLLNEVGSYYTDTEGNVIGGYYTQDEIRETVAYAAKRNIEIIPEIDLPGHSTAIAASYPFLSCSGETIPVANVPGIHTHILCGGKEETLSFLYELLDEMIPLFPGKYFHIGGDEAPKSEWIKCPHCQKKIRELGLKDEEELQGYFTQRLENYLKKNNKILIGWNEILKSDRITDAVAQYYVESEDTYCYERMKRGQRFIFSNEYANYLDYVHTLVPMRAVYSYEPDIQGHGDIPKEQVMGLEAALWTEDLASMEAIERNLFPRLLAFAENAWTREKDYDDFRKRAKQYEAFLREAGIACTPVEEADYHGEDVPAQVADAMCRHLFFLGRNVPMFVVQAFMRAIMQMVNNMKRFGYSEEECMRARDLIVEYLTTGQEEMDPKR